MYNTPVIKTSPPLKPQAAAPGSFPAFAILGALSVGHFVNDMTQSLLLAIYPMLKASFRLSFTQIGLIALAFQLTASLL